jgi:hypothetical protein
MGSGNALLLQVSSSACLKSAASGRETNVQISTGCSFPLMFVVWPAVHNKENNLGKRGTEYGVSQRTAWFDFCFLRVVISKTSHTIYLNTV